MKIAIIFGTRPEIIRLSLVIRRLEKNCDLVLVHTGQNFERNLSQLFIEELGVRAPDIELGIRSRSFGEQAGAVLEGTEQLLDIHRPDRMIVLGDTNSALSAIVGARKGIPVFHMEAGNRCFDDRVPEEVNRRLIDHSSTILMPYTHRAKENLLREGVERERIFVTGNPIKEVIDHFVSEIDSSGIAKRLGLSDGGYILATVHRAENVDDPERLCEIFRGIGQASKEIGLPAIVSVHPRTADRLKAAGEDPSSENVRLVEPLGFFDFVRLEKGARCVLTDSGTVQEECAIFGIPNVTVRDVTERPETLECGSNILAGADAGRIAAAARTAVEEHFRWEAPPEYRAGEVSRIVAKIVLGRISVRRHR